MTPAEIGHRVRARAAQAQAERWGFVRCTRRPRRTSRRPSQPWIASPMRDRHARRYVAAAERIVAGQLRRLRAARTSSSARRRAGTAIPRPASRRRSPSASTLDYRDPDARRRLQVPVGAQPPPAPRHARAGLGAHGERATSTRLREHLESWFDRLPVPHGAELVERARGGRCGSSTGRSPGSCSAAPRRRCSRATRAGLRARAGCASVYQHARVRRAGTSRCTPRPTTTSSARPRACSSPPRPGRTGSARGHWRDTAQRDPRARGAAAERARRREPRAGRLLPAVDLRPAAAAAARRRARTASVLRARTRARLEAMLEFLASIMDAGGNVPHVRRRRRRLRGAPRSADERLLPLPLAARHRRDPLRPRRLQGEGADALDDKTRWLLGPKADAQLRRRCDARRRACRCGALSPRAATTSSAATSRRRDEIRLVADAGPLGYRAIAAHGHADALSFTLSAGRRRNS